MIRPLVHKYDPILKEKMPRFDFSNPEIDPSELAHILAQNMIHYGGIGLAAPQIGLRYRAFIMKGEQLLCFFNPLVVDKTSEMVYLEEGCLTFPDMLVKIKRPAIIKVRYTLPNNVVETNKFIGLTSRIVQHEIDHLDGILFTERAGKYHLEQAKNRMKRKVL